MDSYSPISIPSRFARILRVFMPLSVLPAILGGCLNQMKRPEIDYNDSGRTGLEMRSSPDDLLWRVSTFSDAKLAQAESLGLESSLLTADQVRCQAANFAILGRLTERERCLGVELHGNRCFPPNLKALQQELLWLRTLSRSNEAAAAALEVFYQMAEAQQQRTILAASRAEIESMRSDLRELKSHDLPVDQEPGFLDRRLLSNQETRSTLNGGIAQGRAKLRVLLGPSYPLAIPEMNLNAEPPLNPPGRMDAMNVARRMHPELRTLQTMLCRITPITLPLARATLQQYEGGLGTVQAAGPCVQLHQLLKAACFLDPNNCPLPSQSRELEARRNQLAELFEQREQAVVAEVEVALIAWETSTKNWQSANRRVASWQEQLDHLVQKQPIDENITKFDLARARLGILEAKADRVRFAFEGRQAQVKLWTAQGVVGAGCLAGDESCGCDDCQKAHGLAPLETSAIPRKDQHQPPSPPIATTEESRQPPMPLPPSPEQPKNQGFRPSSKPAVSFRSCRPLTRRK